MSAPVSLVVAGAGLIGRRHAAAIARAAGVRLAGIVDPAPGARALAGELGVPAWGDLAEMPAGAADGVILATPTQAHVEGALACIARGLPALVEKPLAADLAGARRIVEAGEAAGIPLATGHHRRHNPLIAAAKAMLEAGAIGRVIAVHGMFWLLKPDDYFAVPWRRQPGAGPLSTNLSHDVDLLRHLLGEVEEVTAATSNAVRGHPVEETAAVLLRFAGGALGTFAVSDAIPAPWSWELTSGENPAYPRIDAPCYMIGGTAGALELPAGRRWHYGARAGWWEPLLAETAPRPAGDPLEAQIEQFAAVVRGEAAPLVSAREGMRTMAVIEAIRASAAAGAPVRVAAG